MKIALILLISLIYSCSNEFKELKTLNLAKYEQRKNITLKKDCASCHKEVTDKWEDSHHFRAMNTPTPEFVSAPFEGEVFNNHGVKYKFTKKDKDYFVTIDKVEHKVVYTFGFDPLQQYIVEIDNGKKQVLPIGWDVKKGRWFFIYKDFNDFPRESLKWNQHVNNWNNRCANCHSSGLVKNYDVEKNTYDTKFVTENISCFSCHGDPKGHILWANDQYKDDKKGFEKDQFTPYPKKILAANIASHSKGEKLHDQRADSKCFSCHALREDYSFDENFNDDFFNQFSIRIVNNQQYELDGQVKEEAFVLGSFSQSKMFHKGVTCLNCHDPHSGKLVKEGNKTCLQCHTPDYEKVSHTKHSSQMNCISCHMPEKTFMGVDSRKDHIFNIPRPDYSKKYGVPNSCTSCHTHMTADVLEKKFLKKYSPLKTKNHFLEVIGNLKLGNFENKDELVALILNKNIPEMQRAYALSFTSNFPGIKLDFFEKLLSEDSLLIKSATLELIQNYPNIDQMKHLIVNLAKSKHKAVSYNAIYNLALRSHPINEDPILKSVLDDYMKSLILHSDLPENVLKIAALSARGFIKRDQEKLLKRNIERFPHFIPSYINLADHYRSIGYETYGLNALKDALKKNPIFGPTNLAIGMHYIRSKNYNKALEHLKSAHVNQKENAYYAYIYAITIHSIYGYEKSMAFIEENLSNYADSFLFNQLAFSLSVEAKDQVRLQKYIKIYNKFKK